jgi:ribonuclease H2 subunit A
MIISIGDGLNMQHRIRKMSHSREFLVYEDSIAMELDSVEINEDKEGGSRPATSATSDTSPIEERLDQVNDAGKQEERPASMPERGTPLTDSYTWISPRPTADGPYAVGVDEAGRGPALGPLVYGMAFCPVAFIDEELAGMGFDGQ